MEGDADASTAAGPPKRRTLRRWWRLFAAMAASALALSVWQSAGATRSGPRAGSAQDTGSGQGEGRTAFAGRFLVEAVHPFTAVQVRTVAEAAQQDVVTVSVGQVYVPRAGSEFATPVAAMAVDPAGYAAAYGDPGLAADLRTGPVLSRSAASLLGLAAGDVTSIGDGPRLEVAAVVDDAALGGRELAVARGASYAGGLGLPAVSDYVVLQAAPRDVPAVMAKLQQALPQERLRAVTAVAEDYFSPSATVLTQAEIQKRFGLFGVRASGGDVSLEPEWVAENVVERHVPVLGSVVCNRAVLTDLSAAMAQLEKEGLADLVDVADFQRAGGCFAPRLVRFDSALSHHTWGIAIDINVADNPLGASPRQDARLVAIMRAHNFTWGGSWVRPDGAHFEWFGSPQRQSRAPVA